MIAAAASDIASTRLRSSVLPFLQMVSLSVALDRHVNQRHMIPVVSSWAQVAGPDSVTIDNVDQAGEYKVELTVTGKGRGVHSHHRVDERVTS